MKTYDMIILIKIKGMDDLIIKTIIIYTYNSLAIQGLWIFTVFAFFEKRRSILTCPPWYHRQLVQRYMPIYVLFIPNFLENLAAACI